MYCYSIDETLSYIYIYICIYTYLYKYIGAGKLDPTIRPYGCHPALFVFFFCCVPCIQEGLPVSGERSVQTACGSTPSALDSSKNSRTRPLATGDPHAPVVSTSREWTTTANPLCLQKLLILLMCIKAFRYQGKT